MLTSLTSSDLPMYMYDTLDTVDTVDTLDTLDTLPQSSPKTKGYQEYQEYQESKRNDLILFDTLAKTGQKRQFTHTPWPAKG